MLSYLHNDLSCSKVPFYTLMYCKLLYFQITICVLSSQMSFWLSFCFKCLPYILNVALPLAIRSTAEWAEMLAVTYLSVSRVYAGKDTWTCKYLIYSNQANFLTEFFIISLRVAGKSQYCTSYLEQRTEIFFYPNSLIFNLIQSFNTNLPKAIVYKLRQSKFVTYDT